MTSRTLTWALRTMQRAIGSHPADGVEAFWRDGYVVLPNVFSHQEIGYLRQTIAEHPGMNGHIDRVRGKFESGKYPSFETIFVWNDTSGDDIFAKFTRSHKLMGLLDSIFSDKSYVYHNKVVLKYPNTPGFRFHQDYYYWYGMGCLYPDMATCYIAIDPATRENGCLQLVPGSQRLGRLDHELYDGVSDSGVKEDRLAVILERMPPQHIELAPGDCVMFHCNTLHGSDANLSNAPRLSLLGCYNTKRNDPYIRNHDHPNFIRQTHVYEPVREADMRKLPDFGLHYRDQ